MEREENIVRWRKLLEEPGLAVLPISSETVTAILVVADDDDMERKTKVLLDHHLTDKADSGMLWSNLEFRYSCIANCSN